MINSNQSLTLTILKTESGHYFVNENAMTGFGNILQKSLFLLQSKCDLAFRRFNNNSTNTY